MKLGTSTGILCEKPNYEQYPIRITLKYLKEAGFHYIDFNFVDWIKKGSPFLETDWESWIDEIKKDSEMLGLEICQSHSCHYNFLDQTLSEAEQEFREMLFRRSLTASHMLGSRVCVMHPFTDFIDREKTFIKNLEYFKRVLDLTGQTDMKIAIENMWDIPEKPIGRYWTKASELMVLAEKLGAKAGICLDFEHMAITKLDMQQAVLDCGAKLIATHVSDTHSDDDYEKMHIMPYLGPIQWNSVLYALKKIGYTGPFSFEISHLTNYMPEELVLPALKLAREIGEYMVKLAD